VGVRQPGDRQQDGDREHIAARWCEVLLAIVERKCGGYTSSCLAFLHSDVSSSMLGVYIVRMMLNRL
jgi:hypothetical protein